MDLNSVPTTTSDLDTLKPDEFAQLENGEKEQILNEEYQTNLQTIIFRRHLLKGIARSQAEYDSSLDPDKPQAADRIAERELTDIYSNPVARFNIDLVDLPLEDREKFAALSSTFLTYPEDIYSDQEKMQFFEAHKEKFLGIATKYYDYLDANLAPEYIAEVQEAAAKRMIDYATENNLPQAVMVNGVVTGGKGTTLDNLGLEALESGTEGILGAKDKHAVFAHNVGTFAPLKDAGLMLNDKVMSLMFAQGAEWWVKSLAAADGPKKPFVMSGFPRTAAQSTFMSYFDPSKVPSAYLFVPKEEAQFRTVSRMLWDRFAGSHIRPDDLNAINTQSGEMSLEWLDSKLTAVFKNLGPDNVNKKDFTTKLRELTELFQEISFSKSARYPKDVNRGEKTNAALADLGIPTQVINGLGKTPQEVTAELAAYLHNIGGYVVPGFSYEI